MLDLLYTICRALVDEPDKVQITWSSDCECIAYEVTVAPSDVGKVVGKRGHISNAVRTLVNSAAMKHKKRVSVNILGDGMEEAHDSQSDLAQNAYVPLLAHSEQALLALCFDGITEEWAFTSRK